MTVSCMLANWQISPDIRLVREQCGVNGKVFLMRDSSLLYIAYYEVSVAHCFMDGSVVHAYDRVVLLHSLFHLL